MAAIQTLSLHRFDLTSSRVASKIMKEESETEKNAARGNFHSPLRFILQPEAFSVTILDNQAHIYI